MPQDQEHYMHQCSLNEALLEAFTEGAGNPYSTAIYICFAISCLVFVVSTITKNYSQVDKLWSITPAIYAWIAAIYNTDSEGSGLGSGSTRTTLMAILTTIWGVRLTANFTRRGGYSWPPWRGDEDYRWALLQEGHLLPILKREGPWMVFNLVFISFYQNFLLLLTAAPSFVAYTMAQTPGCKGLGGTSLSLWGLDGLATVIMLGSITIEALADNQQFSFQTEKYRQINAGVERKGDYANGFSQSGLYSIVRKPNYAAEQMTWISFYIFSVAATGSGTGSGIVKGVWYGLNWSAVGWILLVILFQGSGWLTEKLTLMKYPDKYADYQKRVPLYVPSIGKLLGIADRGNKSKSSATSNAMTEALEFGKDTKEEYLSLLNE